MVELIVSWPARAWEVRVDALVSGDVFLFGSFRLDRGGGGLFGDDGHLVALGSRALDLLEFLIDRQGQLVSKQQIMDAVWSGLTVDEKNLTVQMSALRRALDSGHARPSCIQTIPGRGYRFVPAVTRVGLDGKSLIDPVAQACGVGEPSVHRHRWSSRLVALTAALILAGLGLGTAITDDAPAICDGIGAPPASARRRAALLMSVVLVLIAFLLYLSVPTIWRMADNGHVARATAPRLSIVVLPFLNIGGDPQEDYLADGITYDLTSDLAHIPDAFVIARASAYTYKGKVADLRQIGNELGVRYVVEGSVRRVGDALRLNVQLIATETGRELWSDRFDERIADLAVGQDRILTRMRSELGISVVDIEAARSQRERPSNPDAFDLILRARSLYNQPRDLAAHKEACALYERALALDPSSVSALSWGAFCQLEPTWSTGNWRTFGDMQRAAQLLARAREIAPNSEEFLYVDQLWLRSQGRCPEVIANGRQIMERLPNSHWRFFNAVGTCELATGHADEDMRILEEAIRRNPRDPYMAWSYRRLGYDLLLLGRSQDAIGFLERALAMQVDNDGDKGWTYSILAAAYALTGGIEEAKNALAEAVRLRSYDTIRSHSPGFAFNETFAAQFRHLQDGLRLAGQRDHADEDADFGVTTDTTLHGGLQGYTPLTAPGAKTIRTADLPRFIAERKPVVIDLLLSFWGYSIPGAIGLRNAGIGDNVNDIAQDRLRVKFAALTGGDLSRPIVAVGWNSERFDGRNLALRLVALGYTNVVWYRGGREAWEVSGLPEAKVEIQDW